MVNKQDPKRAVPFTKMQALGNDYIVLNEDSLAAMPLGMSLLNNWENQGPLLARKLCNRYFGIGADGLILARQSHRSDCQLGWAFLNSDGSPSDMCGNGLRCLALWAWQNKLVPPIPKDHLYIATLKGPVLVTYEDPDHITSNLGEPILESNLVPVTGAARSPVLQEALSLDGESFSVTCIGMGNPHCVVFEPSIKKLQYPSFGPLIATHEFFPEGANVEFATLINTKLAQVYVWERGSGATLACASGAAATLVAGVLENRLARQATIQMPGGNLEVTWSEADNQVRISGPARQVYQGIFDLLSFYNNKFSNNDNEP